MATEGTIPLADAVGLTVGEVMIREPKTLPAEASDYVDPNPLTVTPGLPNPTRLSSSKGGASLGWSCSTKMV